MKREESLTFTSKVNYLKSKKNNKDPSKQQRHSPKEKIIITNDYKSGTFKSSIEKTRNK